MCVYGFLCFFFGGVQNLNVFVGNSLRKHQPISLQFPVHFFIRSLVHVGYVVVLEHKQKLSPAGATFAFSLWHGKQEENDRWRINMWGRIWKKGADDRSVCCLRGSHVFEKTNLIEMKTYATGMFRMYSWL